MGERVLPLIGRRLKDSVNERKHKGSQGYRSESFGSSPKYHRPTFARVYAERDH